MAVRMIWAALIGLGACFCSGDPEPPVPVIGVSVDIPAAGSSASVVRDLAALRQMGARLLYVSVKWAELEPQPGHYVFKPIDDATNGARMLGFRLLLTLQTIDTNNRTLPADLQTLPFGDRRIAMRFSALLRALAPRITKEVAWVMLGNEADVYLAAHPAELEPFAELVESGRAVLHAAHRGVAVGVTATFDGVLRHPAVVRRLNRNTDVLGLTYYPLGGDFTVRPARDVAEDVDAMARFAGGKLIVLQEAGYPAGRGAGSSDAAQAEFVDALFAALARHARSFQAVNYFLLYDFGKDMVEGFVRYYGVPGERFRAFLATLGLKREDGTPRPAWEHFRNQLTRWRMRMLR
ncbi:MAG: hypothetical protein ACP5VE_11810 [Chthonomonadales bacterium]